MDWLKNLIFYIFISLQVYFECILDINVDSIVGIVPICDFKAWNRFMRRYDSTSFLIGIITFSFFNLNLFDFVLIVSW